MDYTNAVDTLLSKNGVSAVLAFLIALAVLLVLAAKAVDAFQKLFKPQKADGLAKHVSDANERFERGERHMEENHDRIMDLREGNRVTCISLIALLNHAIHNGNTLEMENALTELNSYLINRK